MSAPTNTPFGDWLRSAPTPDDKGSVPAPVTLTLGFGTWLDVRNAAYLNGTTIDEILSFLITHGLELSEWSNDDYSMELEEEDAAEAESVEIPKELRERVEHALKEHDVNVPVDFFIRQAIETDLFSLADGENQDHIRALWCKQEGGGR